MCAGDWWPFAEDARRRYRCVSHPAILPHEQVLCNDALDLAQSQLDSQRESPSAYLLACHHLKTLPHLRMQLDVLRLTNA